MHELQKTDEFYQIRHYINHLIIIEMKFNRISSVMFFNRKPTKPIVAPPPVPSIHDDSDEDAEPEVEVEIEGKVNECFISEQMLPVVQAHYEKLHFIWVQEEDKIILSWT